MRVLFVSSNPGASGALQLAREQRMVEDQILMSKLRERIHFDSVAAARPSDLMRKLNSFRPHVLHFSGHGNEKGEIVLEDESGKGFKAASPSALKALFSAFRPELQVVVLNACYSGIQADSIAEVVEAIVAMDSAIDDSSAIAFSSAFYSALGHGQSISSAVEQGKASILLERLPGEDTVRISHLSDKDLTLLSVDSSAIYEISSDTKTPAQIRDLLESGARLIEIPDEMNSGAMPILLILALRQSDSRYVLRVPSKNSIEFTADCIVDELLSPRMKYTHDWTLVLETEDRQVGLSSIHTVDMAGLRSGDRVLLLGNHRAPEWAPSAG